MYISIFLFDTYRCLYAITLIEILTSQQLKLNPLDLTNCDLVCGSVEIEGWFQTIVSKEVVEEYPGG